MEIISLETFIFSWRLPALILIAIIGFRFWGWLERERKGENIDKKYPLAQAMDELARSGELEDKDVNAAILSIDPSTPKDIQVLQFKQNIQSQTSKPPST